MSQESPKSSARRRRERLQQQARDEILDAAVAAFAQAGYRSAKMSDIAAQAGYTTANLYTYFASKRTIFDGLVERTLRQLKEAFDQPWDREVGFETQLRHRLQTLFSWADERRDAFLLLFTLHRDHMAAVARGESEPAQDGHGLVVELFERWFRAAQPAALRGLDPAEMAGAFYGIAVSFFFRWLADARGGDLSDRADLVVDLFLHGAEGVPRD